MTNPVATDLTALHDLVTNRDGAGIVVWCLEHGGFREAADPYALRWVSPYGAPDITIGPERGADHQVLARSGRQSSPGSTDNLLHIRVAAQSVVIQSALRVLVLSWSRARLVLRPVPHGVIPGPR